MLITDHEHEPEPRDRSTEQIAAARRFLAALAGAGDAVRTGATGDTARDTLRRALAELGHAGIPADDCTNAINAATALLASQLNTPGVVAIAAPPIPAEPVRHAGPAAFVLARVRSLLDLGEHVTIKVATPRASVAELARRIRVAAPGCGVVSAELLSTTIGLGAIDLVVVEPPVIPSAEIRRAAAERAGAELERIAELEGGASRGR